VSEDWVVRYNHRLLQLERQSQHWAPAKSRVRVRENEAGKIAIHYRGQRLLFRELKAASKALSWGRDVAPSPAPIPEAAPVYSSLKSSLETRPRLQKLTPLFRAGLNHNQGTFLLWYDTTPRLSLTCLGSRHSIACP